MMFHEAYKRIWLQVDPDGDAPVGSEYPLCDGATWCQDKVNDNDVEYVRADEVEALRAEVAALTKGWKEATWQHNGDMDAMYKKLAAVQADRDSQQRVCIKAQADNARLRGHMLNIASFCRIWGGEAERARKMLEEAFVLATPLDDSALQDALKAERERCARVCEELFAKEAEDAVNGTQTPKYHDIIECAAAIRGIA